MQISCKSSRFDEPFSHIKSSSFNAIPVADASEEFSTTSSYEDGPPAVSNGFQC